MNLKDIEGGSGGLIPWVEKYRPRTIGDIAHQTEVIKPLKHAVACGTKNGELPHMLLYGPPGTGKTSTALALVRDLFGPKNCRSRMLELNASDERGIKVVRDKIKLFARTTVSRIKEGEKDSNGNPYPCPAFKVIILDEADAITNDAQTALRRTMEEYSTVTRFILICNYVSKIIQPLASRCAKFRFNPLPKKAMIDHLKIIAKNEDVLCDDKILEDLVENSMGDLRKAINTMQSAHRMTNGGRLTEIIIAEVACLVPKEIVDKFDSMTATKNEYRNIRKMVDDIIYEGYSAVQLLTQYTRRLGTDSMEEGVGRLNSLQKAKVALILADADRRLIDGTDEKIQLYNVATRISKVASFGEDIQDYLDA